MGTTSTRPVRPESGKESVLSVIPLKGRDLMNRVEASIEMEYPS